MGKTYAELKISQQTATELEQMLDKHFGFIKTTTEEYKREQEAFYEGILYAAELLFTVKIDKQGKHHIKPYPTE